MADVVLKLPVREGREAQLFGDFLNAFLASCEDTVTAWGADNDAPYLMMHSDPQVDLDLKVLTFQENSAAQAFRSGWDAAARGLAPSQLNG